MNINNSRYMDSIGAKGFDKNTFLNNWYLKSWNKFYSKHKKEMLDYCSYRFEMYNNISSYEEWKSIQKQIEKQDPTNIYKFEYMLTQIPFRIECWLCCGFKFHYDKDIKQWEPIENYHMINKLSRYETWKNVHITWWDKLRFKWITGYNFE